MATNKGRKSAPERQLPAFSQVARGERFVDPTINSFHAEVSVNEDRDGTGEWRVEYFYNDGGCCVTFRWS